MLVLPQIANVKWNGRNKKRLVELGYPFTKMGDVVKVSVEHLSNGSDALVDVECDYCNEVKNISYVVYIGGINSQIEKYACDNCKSEKIKEEYRINLKGLKLHKHCESTSLDGIIYKFTENINSLDDIQKILINEVQRFCEENGRFPKEKEMSNKNGYISRTQYYHFFNTDTFTTIYNYIKPIEELKPDKINCHKCGELKDFNEDNFNPGGKFDKFGLKKVCRSCVNEETVKRRYKKMGIVFDKHEDISPEEWWEHLNSNKIRYLPDFCYTEENIKKIFRYIFLNKLNYNRKDLCDEEKFNVYLIKQLKVYPLYTTYKNKLNFLQEVFPEYNIHNYDLKRVAYTDNSIDYIISEWIKTNELKTTDLLQTGLTHKFTNKIDAMLTRTFNSKYDMLLWYFNRHDIKHPATFQKITIHDFQDKPNGYWDNRENRLFNIHKYCESKNINDSLTDTEKLKKWVYENFKQSDIVSVINDYHRYYDSLYHILVDSYPQITDNKILFDWEWHQFNKSDRKTLLRAMREFVFYRANKFIKNPIEDIPKYINYQFMSFYCSKFNKQIVKKRFKNYYDWCSQAFPEYADKWIPEDFGICVAFDGTVCGSSQEKFIYELFKIECNIRYLEAIGFKRKGKHVFILDDDSEDNMYCPDFVLEYIDVNGKKIKLFKPIYIEYYGMYNENQHTEVLINYREKTARKNEFYKNNNDIVFIDLYPNDLANGAKILMQKVLTVIYKTMEQTTKIAS